VLARGNTTHCRQKQQTQGAYFILKSLEATLVLSFCLLPAGRARSVWPAGPKITLCFPHQYPYASALTTCTIIMSRKLLPCNLQSPLAI